MTSRFGLLLSLLFGCGRTERNEVLDWGPALGGAGSGGSSGAPVMAGKGGGGGTGGALAAGGGAAGAGGGPAELNCLFPALGSALPPRAESAPARYALAGPYPLDAPAWSDFAGAFDVNGDAVSDLLLLDRSASPPRFRLLLSSPPPSVPKFEEVDCAALQQLPEGRLMLRDLNADGVLDFVVGTREGLRAFSNGADGLTSVLEHRLPPNERSSLINLGLADLDGDEQADLVVGVDRLLSETSIEFELQAQAFMQKQGRFAAGKSLATRYSGSFPDPEVPIFTGYLAAGRFRPAEAGSALLVAFVPALDNFTFMLQTRFGDAKAVPLPSPLGQNVHQVFDVPRPGAHSLALAVGDTDFFLLDLAGAGTEAPPLVTPKIVTTQRLKFRGGPSHELGGGGESPRAFVYDIDSDGDLDFIEIDPSRATTVLHLNSLNESFGEAQALEVNVQGPAETPFFRFGRTTAVVGRTLPEGALVAYLVLAN